jgi:hypothetical protein
MTGRARLTTTGRAKLTTTGAAKLTTTGAAKLKRRGAAQRSMTGRTSTRSPTAAIPGQVDATATASSMSSAFR